MGKRLFDTLLVWVVVSTVQSPSWAIEPTSPAATGSEDKDLPVKSVLIYSRAWSIHSPHWLCLPWLLDNPLLLARARLRVEIRAIPPRQALLRSFEGGPFFLRFGDHHGAPPGWRGLHGRFARLSRSRRGTAAGTAKMGDGGPGQAVQQRSGIGFRGYVRGTPAFSLVGDSPGAQILGFLQGRSLYPHEPFAAYLRMDAGSGHVLTRMSEGGDPDLVASTRKKLAIFASDAEAVSMYARGDPEFSDYKQELGYLFVNTVRGLLGYAFSISQCKSRSGSGASCFMHMRPDGNMLPPPSKFLCVPNGCPQPNRAADRARRSLRGAGGLPPGERRFGRLPAAASPGRGTAFPGHAADGAYRSLPDSRAAREHLLRRLLRRRNAGLRRAGMARSSSEKGRRRDRPCSPQRLAATHRFLRPRLGGDRQILSRKYPRFARRSAKDCWSRCTGYIRRLIAHLFRGNQRAAISTRAGSVSPTDGLSAGNYANPWDHFDFHPQIPQLLKSFGFKYAILHNHMGGGDAVGYTMPLDCSRVSWQGLDGTPIEAVPVFAGLDQPMDFMNVPAVVKAEELGYKNLLLGNVFNAPADWVPNLVYSQLDPIAPVAGTWVTGREYFEKTPPAEKSVYLGVDELRADRLDYWSGWGCMNENFGKNRQTENLLLAAEKFSAAASLGPHRASCRAMFRLA